MDLIMLSTTSQNILIPKKLASQFSRPLIFVLFDPLSLSCESVVLISLPLRGAQSVRMPSCPHAHSRSQPPSALPNLGILPSR